MNFKSRPEKYRRPPIQKIDESEEISALNLELNWLKIRREMSVDEENEKDYLNHTRIVRPNATGAPDSDLDRPLFGERKSTWYTDSIRTTRSDSIKPTASRSRRMGGRAMRVIVVGGKKVGKTAILRQVACVEDITNKTAPTLSGSSLNKGYSELNNYGFDPQHKI
ncbi:Protein CBG11917 [Caenorhabditis briggsae]|uniref:Protein CBG11917 n=1 Tax=Caenorhabditis briggsae TaxID=6238 RepID=A8XEL1_CAEBR|nr:Protein CBG11917 [Caenorhabditis briggsae]CAP30979.2 Protein CBG11917 [Caenorhabditis briggsae]